MKQSIGFIGGGRITKVLLQAFCNRNVKFSNVTVTDPSSEALTRLRKCYPDLITGDAKMAAAQDIVFISLHPPVIMDTLEEIRGTVKAGSIVISLAPKINLAKISSKLSNVKNVARLIPNATSIINKGYNPVTFSAGFDTEKKKEITGMLEVLGNTFEVAEEKLESYAIMSAMLPTYFWFQWRELAEIGKQVGLTDDESRESIRNTLTASLDLMYNSGLSPNEVIDLIPVRPIAEYENQISEIYKTKLLGLFEKIKP